MFLTRDALEITKNLRCKLSQKQMFKPVHLLNAASLKFCQINASFSTMKPFLLDSNFRNGYSLYHKVADLFDTFEGKFIPALRLLLVYLGDKCQRVPLLITRLRCMAARGVWQQCGPGVANAAGG